MAVSKIMLTSSCTWIHEFLQLCNEPAVSKIWHNQSGSGTHDFIVLSHSFCNFLTHYLYQISRVCLVFCGLRAACTFLYCSPGSNLFLLLFCMKLTSLVYDRKWKCRQSQGHSGVFNLPKSMPSSSAKTPYFSFGELSLIPLPLVCWDCQSGDLFSLAKENYLSWPFQTLPH